MPENKAKLTQVMAERIRLGISACLLGERVRFDGGHKRDPFLTDMLGRFVDWVPVCPELECGLGTPREALRLTRHENTVQLMTTKSGRDCTETMTAYSRERLEQLAREDLSGFVLKKDSPSCGLHRVKVYGPAGVPTRSGRGLFAEALAARFPWMPVEEEGRLCDAVIREHFVERIFEYRRLVVLFQREWTFSDLVRFHTSHKMALLAHGEIGYRRLGRLVATGRSLTRAELESRYFAGFMEALERPVSRRRHTNVLQHMLGHLKESSTRPRAVRRLASLKSMPTGICRLLFR